MGHVLASPADNSWGRPDVLVQPDVSDRVDVNLTGKRRGTYTGTIIVTIPLQ